MFRHGYFFINTDKGIKTPADLKGKRGGVPEYSMTAAVYMRGLLQHEYGVKPSDVEWVQGRADRLGRKLPPDIRLTQAPAGTELGDLLERGEIDFMMTANNPLVVPARLAQGAAAVSQLCRGREGLLPPHQDLSDHAHGGDPPRRLRARSVGGAEPVQGALPRQGTCLSSAGRHGLAQGVVAWLQPLIEEEQAIIGPDWFPYGIEPNRPTIEALLQYTHEHGLTDRRVKLEELFAPSTLRDIPMSEAQQV